MNNLQGATQLYSQLLYKQKMTPIYSAVSYQEAGRLLNGDDLEQIWYPYGRKETT